MGSRRRPALSGMVVIPGGTFLMGSNEFYPEERPIHERRVEPFELDRTPVTNDAFAEFVAETGYVTVAESELDADEYPELDDDERAPGSLVFTPTIGPVDLRDWRQWWSWVPGANWQHPRGPASSIYGIGDHPVVQVAYADAVAYATWAGKRLPTEAEAEYAARGGTAGTPYAWGSERDPGGAMMANTWRGRFPYLNTAEDGWAGTSPVGAFSANLFGLYDTIGNVWEWTSDDYTPDHRAAAGLPPARIVGACSDDVGSDRPCCTPTVAGLPAISAEPGSTVPRRVLKGGSHLCAPEYCLRYRPAARSPQAEDSATNHIGFRCARSLG